MGAIGVPKRKVEYWPLETPVPARRAAPSRAPRHNAGANKRADAGAVGTLTD